MKRMILAAVLSLSLALSAPAPLLYAEEIPTETQEEGKETEAAEPELKTESFDADSAPDNDQLFQQYVNRTFGISSSTKTVRRIARRSRLSITEQPFYDSLKAKVEAAANGELSSSDFTFSVSDVYSTFLSTQYTASDLGVTALYDDDGNFTEEAQTAINEICYPTLGNVLKYIFNDCPYDCYWIDGTVGWSYGGVSFYPVTSTTGTGTVSFKTYDSSIPYTIKVSKDYSRTGNTGTTDIDTAKTAATKKAVANAKQIVTDAASKSDYDKLKYYSDQICELTSYNSEAAKNNPAYGDPWQLIYVFDGDSTTNVVCEGYAKAFKYLCDQSTFSSSDIACYTVSGWMSGGTGSGNHMWNVVHMDDGFNYIVDVTNSDTGTVGAYSGLFLGHALDDENETSERYSVKAYSSESGYKNGSYTDIYYSYDSDTINEYSAQERAIRNISYGTAARAEDVNVVTCLGYVVAGTNQVSFSVVLEVPDSMKQGAARYYLKMTAGDTSTSVKLKDAMESPYYTDDVEGYKFSISLPVKQMADTVTMQFYGPEDSTVGDAFSFSVKECLEKIVNGASYGSYDRKTAKAMLNYGAAAQAYFNYHTDNLANAGLSSADQETTAVTADDVKNAISALGDGYSVTNKEQEQSGQTKVEYLGSSLNLESQAVMRTYFRFPEGTDGLSFRYEYQYTGSFDNYGTYDFTDSDRVRQAGNGDVWYIESYPVSAGYLKDQMCIQVVDSSSNVLLQVKDSPLEYIYRTLKNSQDTDLITLCRTLYAYYDSARYSGQINMSTKTVDIMLDANGGYFSDYGTGTTSRTVSLDYGSDIRNAYSDVENTSADLVFDGWYYDSGLTDAVEYSDTATKAVTLYAKWVKGHTVTLNANGGVFNGDKTSVKMTVADGNSLQITEWPYGNGSLLFTNWYYDAACTEIVKEPYSYVPTDNNTVFYAGWGEECMVTFNANGGTFQNGSSTYTVTFGKGITNIGAEQPVSSDSSKTFGGWYYDAACTNPVGDLSAYTVTGNVTLYAGWEDSYTLTLDANGGYFPYNDNQATVSFTVAKGTTGVPYQTPSTNTSGKAFKGWYYDAACTNAVGDLSVYTMTGDITFYAGWADGYTITFNANGGYFNTSSGTSETKSETFAKGTWWSYVTPYNSDSTLGFTGWYSDKECTKEVNYIPNGDITLYAGWSTNYTVIYDANGGYFTGTYENQTYNNALTLQQQYPGSYGALHCLTPKNSDSKLSFNGWFTDKACTNAVKYLSDYKPTKDTTLYAGWLDTSSITLYPVTDLKVSDEGVISFSQGENYGSTVWYGAYVKKSTGYTTTWTAISGADGAKTVSLDMASFFQSRGAGTYTITIKTAATSADTNDFSSGTMTSITYTYTGSSSSSSGS